MNKKRDKSKYWIFYDFYSFIYFIYFYFINNLLRDKVYDCIFKFSILILDTQIKFDS